MVASGYQENCVKSPKQVYVLGIARGYHLLPTNLQQKVANHEHLDCHLHTCDMENLEEFLQDLGLLYHHLHVNNWAYLVDQGSALPSYVKNTRDYDEEYWTRTGDGCYENLSTGAALNDIFSRHHNKTFG